MTALIYESRDLPRPLFLLCDTTKGKGVSFMENQVLWHYRTAQGEEYERAKLELDNTLKELIGL